MFEFFAFWRGKGVLVANSWGHADVMFFNLPSISKKHTELGEIERRPRVFFLHTEKGSPKLRHQTTLSQKLLL